MKNKMRVLIVEPHMAPYESEIGTDLKSMQKAVSGLIEPIDIDECTTLVCNEEAKLEGLEGNRRVGRDIIAGTFFICGYMQDGEFCSLTDKQVEKYTERFKKIEHYTQEEVEDSMFIEVYDYPEDDEEQEL